MARLIPKVAVSDIALKPERDVARQLVALLPDECVVYHSYPWLKSDRNDRDRKTTLREGEADFVVVIPSHGLLVLEVKGGTIDYQSDNRGWHRRLDGGGRKDIQDPFEQARRNAHFLAAEIRDKGYRGADKLPFAFGYAVVFPDCEFLGPAPPGAELAILLTTRDLPHLDRRLGDALRQWSRSTAPQRLDKLDLEAIQRAISPSFQLLPVLFRQIEEQEERLFRLTEDQLRLLDFLSHHERAAIEGVAGSGKTLLARAQVQRFADAGRKTLLVCYNRALAEWLRTTIPETYADRVTVLHFHALCNEWCKKAGIRFSPPGANADRFWNEEAAYLLLEAIDQVPDRFDAVVVDEGQDFPPDWWSSLEQINSDGGRGSFYVFYDPAQNLFVEGQFTLPDLGKPFQLATNCRNTRKIAATCGEIIGRSVATRQDAPEGVETGEVTAATPDEQRRVAQALLHEWIGKGGLKMSQVAILSPLRYNRSSIAGLTGGKFPLTEDLGNWRAGRSVLFSTIRAFKGLEADAVILMDLPKPDSVDHFTRSDYYVACSRAKHLLAILHKET
jgi:hypothetical protein